MKAEPDLIYCYPDSNVLINLLDLRDGEALKKAERIFTSARLMELMRHPVQGSFDLEHLKRIHHHIFQDLYTWAGELRRVEIAKGLYFCRAQYIEPQAANLFKQLKRDQYLKDCSHEELVKKAAWYFSEINAIHPFRDGNGRAQREFIRELLLNLRVSLSWQPIRPEQMIEASIASFHGDYGPMEQLFEKCVGVSPANPEIGGA